MGVFDHYLLVESKKHTRNCCYIKCKRVFIMILSHYDFVHYDFVHYDFIGTPQERVPKQDWSNRFGESGIIHSYSIVHILT